jgi:Resolvase, N terminal domain
LAGRSSFTLRCTQPTHADEPPVPVLGAQTLKCDLPCKCGHFHKRNRGGFNWDKSPSTAASRPTISRASARKGSAGVRQVRRFNETASGVDNARPERAKVLALAQAHEIDAILVTELSRWCRSTQDLVQTLDDLHGWKVSAPAWRCLPSPARPKHSLPVSSHHTTGADAAFSAA